MTRVADVALAYNWDPDELLEGSTTRFLFWKEALDRQRREEDNRSLRIAMAGHQLQLSRDGMSTFREYLRGEQSEKAKAFQQKYNDLMLQLAGIG